jgi:hypothetical protein
VIPEGTLNALRATTESTMRDQCIITRSSTDARTFNPATGDYSDPTATTVYEGACRVRYDTGGRGETESAGGQVALRQYGATRPRTAGDIREGDVFTVTDSDDQYLVGRHLYVLAVRWSTENLHRRLVLEDRQ